ncbi:MAG: hypothetical protein H6742_19245 [Alphaproteobacteria bacterium]|nr:hypothetical protein [Alphaproteobacteria bacterium]
MRPSSEARVGIGSLLALQLLTSVAGVLLLSRMAPAVEHILMDNVYSTVAVEEMLLVLAAEEPPEQFEEALARAHSNVTEDAELPLLARIDAEHQAALDGDAQARARVARDLRDLGAVNHQSMEDADALAQRLGLAGAWAMALLGFLGFLVSIGLVRRVQDRLLRPIVELDAVLEAVRAGDLHRRCSWVSADRQVARTMANLDWVLDRRGPAQAPIEEDPRLRGALLALLDRETERPQVLGGPNGMVFAVNAVGLSALHGDHSAPRLLAAARAGTPPDGWQAEALGEGLLLLTGPVPAPAAAASPASPSPPDSALP